MSMKPVVGAMLSLALVSMTPWLGGISPAVANDIELGKKVAFDRKKGNCLACHMMSDGALPGNIGPPLIAMKVRFPNKADLRAQIWDPTANNPNTIMPPFGKHRILNEREIELITAFVYTL